MLYQNFDHFFFSAFEFFRENFPFETQKGKILKWKIWFESFVKGIITKENGLQIPKIPKLWTVFYLFQNFSLFQNLCFKTFFFNFKKCFRKLFNFPHPYQKLLWQVTATETKRNVNFQSSSKSCRKERNKKWSNLVLRLIWTIL